jgi:polyisoprenyl-phosphate glycosyltransferase
MRSISVIVPVYNNASTIEELFDRLRVALEPLTSRYEIIFVNDGSADDSWQTIRSMCQSDSRCVGIQLSRNFGQHPAINAALHRASGDITVLMDADLQDRPEELPKLLARFDENDETDIVYTQFTLEAGGKSRVTSRVFHTLYARLTGNRIPTDAGTYRAFTRRVREALLDYPERSAVYGPLMVQMGFDHVYVPVSRSAAVGRKTSYTFAKRLSLAISALISYSSFLHWVVTLIGLLLTSLSGIFLVVITAQYLSGTRVLVNGQLLLIGITVLLSGVLVMCSGILTAYTTRIFQEVLARPKYHVSRELGTGLAKAVQE